jgi:predicted nucleic acid-binding protein
MIVINSSPAINLTAVLGGLDLLVELYGPVIVPLEVFQELEAGASKDGTALRLRETPGIEIREQLIEIPLLLGNLLDLGEAAVIQTALEENLSTVILDDLKGRRAARLAGLEVTGSLGVLVQAKRVGRLKSVAEALQRLQARGTWLDKKVVESALLLAGETSKQ